MKECGPSSTCGSFKNRLRETTIRPIYLPLLMHFLFDADFFYALSSATALRACLFRRHDMKKKTSEGRIWEKSARSHEVYIWKQNRQMGNERRKIGTFEM